MSYNYGMEKMHLAVYNLVGPGTMQSRLANAVNSHLIHMEPESDLPKELVGDYQQILQRLNAHGDVQEELRKISEQDAEHIAQQIVSLYEKTAHLVH